MFNFLTINQSHATEVVSLDTYFITNYRSRSSYYFKDPRNHFAGIFFQFLLHRKSPITTLHRFFRSTYEITDILVNNSSNIHETRRPTWSRKSEFFLPV